MDLLDFETDSLYFDNPLPDGVAELLEEASRRYSEGGAEPLLLRAYFVEPRHLTVLVALYRYYYYRHDYESALVAAARALEVSGSTLDFPADWRTLHPGYIGQGAMRSIAMTRFYLLALKGAAYLELRLDRPSEALERLLKIEELDSSGRLGVEELVRIARRADSERQLAGG